MTKASKDSRKQNFKEDIDLDRFLYNIWDRKKNIENSEDVAQKRYKMIKLFDYLLKKTYILNNQSVEKYSLRIKKLQEFDGYMYKLSQEFLMSSSTLEKENKLDKMIKHLTRGIGNPKQEWKSQKEESEDN